MLKEAMFYATQNDNVVKCSLCPHNCVIADGERGKCGVRENARGTLLTLVYGKAIAKNIDPIEKKPIFHFLPGSDTYSLATVGCNLSCKFCQNWEISQSPKPKASIQGHDILPKQIIQDAIEHECKSISYTYTEPTIFFEYAYETAKLARENNLKNIFVSNGFISLEAIEVIAPFLDAINIDLKSFNENFYKNSCGGKLQPVLDAIKEYHRKGIWIEITTLLIPKKNDSESEISQIAEFIANLDNKIPWHISRFHPDYQMDNLPSTDSKTIERAYEIGKSKGLKYIYVGNLPHSQHENTFCPKCNKVLIERQSFFMNNINLKDRQCSCKEPIDIILK